MWNAADIQHGMEVLGLDGRQVGTVSRVWLDVFDGSAFDVGTLGHHLARGLMPLDQMSGTDPVRGGYFAVESDGNQGSLYVPFDAVQILFPGQNVTLSCSASECWMRFKQRPMEVPDPQVAGSLRR